MRKNTKSANSVSLAIFFAFLLFFLSAIRYPLSALYAADTVIKGTTTDSTVASLNVTNSGDSSLLYVQNDGKVGIGTVAPTRELNISNAIGNAEIQFTNGPAGKNWHIGSSTNNFAITETDVLTRMTIQAGGNVGIGTAAPLSNLHIKLDNTNGELRVDETGGSAAKIFNSNGFLVLNEGGGAGVTLNDTTGEVMRVDAGRVGIGTTAPAYALDVKGATGIGYVDYLTNSLNSARISTFGNTLGLRAAGSGDNQLVITNAGNVGIGTTSPSYKLHVVGPGAAALNTVIENDGNQTNLNFLAWGAQSYYTGMLSGSRGRGTKASPSYPLNDDILFEINAGGWQSSSMDTANGARLIFAADGTWTSSGTPGKITFGVNDGTTNWNGEAKKMTLRSSGNLGIGTTAPEANLHVLDRGTGDDNQPKFKVGNGVTSNATVSIVTHDGTNAFHVWDEQGGVPISRFLVQRGGNVGIGTTSPGAPLTFAQSTGDKIRFFDPGVASRSGVGINNSNMQFYIPAVNLGPNTITFNSGGDLQAVGTNELMRIDNTGNVGIGTTNPSYLLQVMGTISGGTVRATSGFTSNDGTVSLPGYRFINDSNTGVYTPSADNLGLVTGGSEKIRIDSSGNVGIGTTAPGVLLDISTSTTGSPVLLALKNTNGGGNGSYLGFYVNGVKQASIGGYDGELQIKTDVSNADIKFLPNGAEKMRITTAGNVGIGTTNPAYSIDIASTNAGLNNTRYTTSGSLGSAVLLNRSNNATIGANTLISNADEEIGKIYFQAANGSGSFTATGRMTAFTGTGGHTSSSDMPTYLVFSTTPDGSATAVQRLRIDEAGNVGIGTTAPGARLEVNGGMRLNTTAAKPTCEDLQRGTFWVTQGTTAAPVGTKDTVEVCAKDASNVYAWRTIY